MLLPIRWELGAYTRCLGWVILLMAGGSLVLAQPSAETDNVPDETVPALLTLRVGYTTFESPDKLHGPYSNLRSVESYLEWLSRETHRDVQRQRFKIPLDFDILPGNDYQIREWMRSGLLDAAVVSPATALLLEAEQAAMPLLEFPEEEGAVCEEEAPGDSAADSAPRGRVVSPGSHRPMVTAVRGGEIQREAERLLENELENLARWALEARRTEDGEVVCPVVPAERFELHLVNHLSTSGFLFPTLYAQEILRRGVKEAEVEAEDTEPIERCFWREYFNRGSFSLHHGSSLTLSNVSVPDEVSAPGLDSEFIHFFFSYSGRSSRNLEETASSDDWRCFWPAGPDIPPDLLVMRPELEGRVLNRQECGASHGCLIPEDTLKDFGGDPGYAEVREFDAERFKELKKKKKALRIELQERWDRWFVEGQFEFSVEDALAILRQDQGIHDAAGLALVLPGGGVKSTYQAAVLDHLYQGGGLTNRITEKEDEGDGKDSGTTPLNVQYVIGTSGGAITGLFTAALADAKGCLASLWLQRPGAEVGDCPRLTEAGRDLVAQVDDSELFQRVGFLRWVSLFWLLCLLFSVSGLFRRVDRFRRARKVETEDGDPERVRRQALAQENPATGTSGARETRLKEPPLRFVWAVLSLVAVTPLTARLMRSQDAEHIPVVEGVLYVFLLVLCHLALVCIKGRPEKDSSEGEESGDGDDKRGDSGGAWRIFAYVLVVGGTLMVISSIGFRLLPDEVKEPQLLSLGVMVGFLWLAFSILLLPRLSGRFCWYRRREQVFGLLVLVAFGAACYFVLWLASIPGWSSLLELTGVFWIWLTAIGLSMAVLFSVSLSQAVVQHPESLAGRAMRFSFTKQNLGPYAVSPRRAFFWFCLVGLLGWNLLNAPAAYSNKKTSTYYRGLVQDRFGVDLADETDQTRALPLTSALVVTGVLLDELEKDLFDQGAGRPECSVFTPGEFFLCFDRGDFACELEPETQSPIERRLRESRWIIQKPEAQRLAAATLASGSPFPIFPPHVVPLQPVAEGGARDSAAASEASPCPVPLVDGGYTNLVPLGAASLLGSRRALVIHSEPLLAEAEDVWWLRPWGRLVRYSNRLLPFLFDRSQELDRRLGEEMLVVSLAPRPRNLDGKKRSFPFLTDFRQAKIRQLWDWAREDLNSDRPLGRVLSWGLPGKPRRFVRCGELQVWERSLRLPQRGWQLPALSALRQQVTDRPVSSAGHRTAVLDLDGGLLTGDLQEVLLAQRLMELWATGALESLWSRLEESGTVDGETLHRLRAEFAEASPAGPRNSSLAKYPRWPGERRAQYRRLLASVAGMPPDVRSTLLTRGDAGQLRRFVQGTLEASFKRFSRNLREIPLEGASGRGGNWSVGVAYHREIRELIYGLQDLGWDVWVVGRAPQLAVAEVSSLVGISPRNVLGMLDDSAEISDPSPATGPGLPAGFEAQELGLLVTADTELAARLDATLTLILGDDDTRTREGWVVQSVGEFRYDVE